MKTFETEYYHVFESEDYRGKFEFRIHKYLRQIQIETGIRDDFSDDDIHVDVNKQELIAIRGLINKVLGE